MHAIKHFLEENFRIFLEVKFWFNAILHIIILTMDFRPLIMGFWSHFGQKLSTPFLGLKEYRNRVLDKFESIYFRKVVYLCMEKF